MIALNAHVTITRTYLGLNTKINAQSHRQFYRTEYTHEDYQHNEVTSIVYI